jgi:hypothetical protein
MRAFGLGSGLFALTVQRRFRRLRRHATVGHTTTVPPVPQLVTIGAADHPREPYDRPYNRVSFSFTSGYPSYRFMYVAKLADGSGQPIPFEGLGVLRIVFSPPTSTGSGTTATSWRSTSTPSRTDRFLQRFVKV